ncbi:F-box domain-containing protein [Pleurotus pulmonarius]
MPPKSPKRQRRRKAKDETETPPCYLHIIPVEVLAEILTLCSSPKDLLAIARCSKYLCSTLIDVRNSFIWRSVRETMHPEPLPDPLSIFPEPAYAAFVFDGGRCSVCQKRVTRSYASFALRIRLCFSPQCCKAIVDQMHLMGSAAMDVHLRRWYLVTENNVCFESSTQLDYSWPTGQKLFMREQDWDAAATQYSLTDLSPEAKAAYIHERNTNRAWVQVHMEFYARVFAWYRRYRAHRKSCRDRNDRVTKSICARWGWNFWDLKTTKTFGALHALRSGDGHLISAQDFNIISGTVSMEMIAKIDKNHSLKELKAQKERMRIIENHYNRLRSLEGKAKKILPNLETFKTFPIISSLQTASSSVDTDMEAQLKSNGLVLKVLNDEIEQWVKDAKAQMCYLLGSPGWKTPDLKGLHLVQRADARFVCIRCEGLWKPNYIGKKRSLDFKDACGHRCPSLGSGNVEWNVDWFKADDKAINVIKKVLLATSVDPSRPNSLQELKDMGAVFACFSCEAAIVMGFEGLAEHAHRHRDMDVAVLKQPEADLILTHPVVHGLTKKILAASAKAMERFGCRHCLQTRTVKHLAGTVGTTALSGETEALAPSTKRRKGKKEKLASSYNFDGLRSHMKAKHGVLTLRDEDYFHNEP